MHDLEQLHNYFLSFFISTAEVKKTHLHIILHSKCTYTIHHLLYFENYIHKVMPNLALTHQFRVCVKCTISTYRGALIK
jgi:hypothetical protein